MLFGSREYWNENGGIVGKRISMGIFIENL